LRGEAKAKDILRLQRELSLLEGSVKDIEEYMGKAMQKIHNVQLDLQVAQTDIAAVQRTMSRAKEAVKLAPKTQPLR